MVVEANSQDHTKQTLETLTSIRNDVLNRIRYSRHNQLDLDFLRLEYQKLEFSLTEVAQSVIAYANGRRDWTVQQVARNGQYHSTGLDAVLCKLDRQAYELVESRERRVRRDAEEIGDTIKQIGEHKTSWRWLHRKTKDASSYFEPVDMPETDPLDGSIATAINALDRLGKQVRSAVIQVHALPVEQASTQRLDDQDGRIKKAFTRFKQTVCSNLELQAMQKQRDLVARGIVNKKVHGRVMAMLQKDTDDQISRARTEADRARKQVAAKRKRIGLQRS